MKEELGPRTVDGIWGPRTKFSVDVFHMTKEQAKAAAREQHGLRLDAEARVAKLEKKIRKMKKKSTDVRPQM